MIASNIYAIVNNHYSLSQPSKLEYLKKKFNFAAVYSTWLSNQHMQYTWIRLIWMFLIAYILEKFFDLIPFFSVYSFLHGRKYAIASNFCNLLFFGWDDIVI